MSDKPGINRIGQVSADEQSMEQIREILFGEQTRHTEQQFEHLDKRLAEQEHTLKALLDERIGGLNESLQGLRDDLDAQDRRQGSALDELNTSLGALLGTLDERLTVLDSDQQDARHRQQQDAADQTAALDALQQRSVGRGQLADLLEAMAGELRDTSSK